MSAPVSDGFYEAKTDRPRSDTSKFCDLDPSEETEGVITWFLTSPGVRLPVCVCVWQYTTCDTHTLCCALPMTTSGTCCEISKLEYHRRGY